MHSCSFHRLIFHITIYTNENCPYMHIHIHSAYTPNDYVACERCVYFKPTNVRKDSCVVKGDEVSPFPVTPQTYCSTHGSEQRWSLFPSAAWWLLFLCVYVYLSINRWSCGSPHSSTSTWHYCSKISQNLLSSQNANLSWLRKLV